MKKNVLFKLFALVFLTSAIVVGVNITLNGSNVNLSDIALSNIEILAQNEGGDDDCCEVSCCPGGCCRLTHPDGRTCRACCIEDDRPHCNMYNGDCECIPR